MTNAPRLGFCLFALSACLVSACAGEPPDGFEPAYPWTDQSRRLELTCGSYWDGAMDFRADRTELSAEQLQIASSLKTAQGVSSCWQDTFGCSVRITDGAGAVAAYLVEEHNSRCSSTLPVIDYATVKPLLATIPCTYGRRTGVAAVPDARCINGLYSEPTIHEMLVLSSAARTYHVDLVYCSAASRAAHVGMKAFGSDPTTPIAVGAAAAVAGPDGACLALDIASPTVPSADLVITTTSDFMPAGDFGFRFF